MATPAPQPVRRVSDEERRARLGRRHALGGGHESSSPEGAAEAVLALHATEPATVYLSCWARVQGIEVADVDRALYDDRSIAKQLAMRRTLFAFPRDLLPAVLPSASARVAATERARLAKQLVQAGITDDGERWIDDANSQILALLARHPEGLTAVEIRAEVPMTNVTVDDGAQVWAAPRLLTYLGARGDISRAANTGHWRTSRTRWTLIGNWLGERPDDGRGSPEGYVELVRRWLDRFGPGTEDDLVWWLGATKGIVRAALAELDAVPVALDHGPVGWLLPDDIADVDPPDPWVALLPVLDSTVMAWKDRAFYLGEHKAGIFDTNGNAGTTALVDGRIVGCWIQDPDGHVRVHLLEPVSRAADRALRAESDRLTQWLDGVVVGTVYRSPAMRAAAST